MIRIIAVSLLLVALPATATPGADKKPVDRDKRICRRLEQTGSIMPPRSVCHSLAEWQAIDRANGAAVEQLRDRPQARNGN